MNEKTRLWIALVVVIGFVMLLGVSIPTFYPKKEFKPFHYVAIGIAGLTFILLIIRIIAQLRASEKVTTKPKQQEECTTCPFMSSWFTIILILLVFAYLINDRFQFINLHNYSEIIQISLISLLILRVGILFYTRNKKR